MTLTSKITTQRKAAFPLWWLMIWKSSAPAHNSRHKLLKLISSGAREAEGRTSEAPHFFFLFWKKKMEKGIFRSLRSLKCQLLSWLCLLCRVTMIGNNLTLDIFQATFYCHSFFLKSWCCLFSMQMHWKSWCVFLGWKKWKRNYGLPHHSFPL